MTVQSGPFSGFSTFEKAYTFKSTDCLPNSTSRPNPPSNGTVQRPSLGFSQFALIKGGEVRLHPAKSRARASTPTQR